ncbi:MAG: hypothetical protein R3F62_27855 [Planctomycetota bacterium]
MIDVFPAAPLAWPLYLESPLRRLDAARRQSEVERAWLTGRTEDEPEPEPGLTPSALASS